MPNNKQGTCKRRKVRKNSDGSLNQEDMEHNRKCEQKYMMVDNTWMKDVLNKKKPTGYNKYLKQLVKKRVTTFKKKSRKSRKTKPRKTKPRKTKHRRTKSKRSRGGGG